MEYSSHATPETPVRHHSINPALQSFVPLLQYPTLPLLQVASPQPPLLPPVVLHLPVALSGSNRGEPQIEFLNVLIVPHCVGRTSHHDTPVLHDIALVCDAKGGPRVLLHQENGHLLVGPDFAYDAVDIFDDKRGKAERRFV